MKKTYIIPEMETVKLETIQLLAGSFIIESNDETKIEDPDEIGSRFGDLW